jgi:hypothetical protein
MYQLTSNWMDFYEIYSEDFFDQRMHFINVGTLKKYTKQLNFLYHTATRGFCCHINVAAREAG